MSEQTRIYWLHALTPLHVGTGSGLGYIDLPVMREKVTNWPLVPGSAIKGVLSDTHQAEDARKKIEDKKDLTKHEKRTICAFGRAGDEHSNSGSLVFTDGRLVCLPVRSLYGTFAWCASALSLQRLARDLELAGVDNPSAPATSCPERAAWTTGNTKLVLGGEDRKVFLEDLDLAASDSQDATAWADWLAQQIFVGQEAWQKAFRERFVIVPDNVFDFLSETGTEVNARVRIEDEKKTVATGALWYEEALPAETILSGLVWCDRVFGFSGETPAREDLFQAYCGDPLDLQIGGKATVGHGRVRCLFTKGGR